MNYNRLIAIVRRELGEADEQTAATAVRAVLGTLSERLMTGLIMRLRQQLPADLARYLVPGQHKLYGADEFVRRVAAAAGTDLRTAEAWTVAVFVALSRALPAEDFRAMVAELPNDYRTLIAPATRPANEPAEFVRRVADRAGLDTARAREAVEAVLETLAERIAGGEVDDLIKELPADVRPALERGKAHSGDHAQKMSLDEFLSRIAAREGADAVTARQHASAVLATVRDAVTDKEFHDVISELPRSYVQELSLG
jgi:uncharacterized protein (DUF2267 family)